MCSLTTHLAEQADWHWHWHWQHRLRPRFDGLTDDEYFWQPVPDCWTVHPDGTIDFVLHVNRDVIHHGAEIALLRDLYVHTTKEN